MPSATRALQPGWLITFRRLNDNALESSTIHHTVIIDHHLEIHLTDGRIIPGRCMTALARADGQGCIVEAWLAKEQDFLMAHPSTPTSHQEQNAPNWTEHWRRLVRSTSGVHASDSRLDNVVRLLQECDGAYQRRDETQFLRIEQRLKHFLRKAPTAGPAARSSVQPGQLARAGTPTRAMFTQLIGHLLERLTQNDAGQANIFRSSTVTNLVEFLNQTDTNPAGPQASLIPLIRQAKALLMGVDSQTLRVDHAFQEVVRTGLERIKRELDLLQGPCTHQNRADHTT